MYLYMMVHPGKKLNFMGSEIGQLREWDEKREQDLDMRKYPIHDAFYRYMTELNRLYLSHPALSQWDYQERGFQWLDCHQESRCIYAIERRSENERLVALFNFSQSTQIDYAIVLPDATGIDPLLYSDWEPFGGKTPLTDIVCQLRGNQLVCSLSKSGLSRKGADRPQEIIGVCNWKKQGKEREKKDLAFHLASFLRFMAANLSLTQLET